jgi:cell wall-associated NlpC family hydrolase
MNRRHWAHLVAATVVVAAVAAAAPAAASTPSGDAGDSAGRSAAIGPAAAATAYLQARAAAITAADPASALAPWVVSGSVLARTEAKLASGTALRGEAFGRTVESADCRVTVLDSQPADDGVTAVVAAHVITMLTWRSASGKTDAEGSGVDHTVTVQRSGDSWVITADAYADVLKPACLEAAGASRARVRAAAHAVERAAAPLRLPRRSAPRAVVPARRYSAIIQYDRPGAQAYADARALSYNPTFVRFAGADCANFASQCARAGDMLQASGGVTSGWWYDKDGSSSPSDDTYSLSWINVTRQIGYWNGRRTDWETSAGKLSRGDFIYYDWTGDGVWDHVAVVAGTNSSGQKVIDAHTTDHYHVYWKLGYTGTKYRYARVRAQWVVV